MIAGRERRMGASLPSFAVFECLVCVSTWMQDAQDSDLIPPNEIERDMLSHSKGPYTQRDRVALFAYFRSKTELLEGEFQLLTVTFGLYRAPLLLCIASNLPEILNG